jgi:hypothetical protein
MILQSVGPPSDQLSHTGESLPRGKAVVYSWPSLHMVLMLGLCTHTHHAPLFVVMVWSLFMHRDKWGLGVTAKLAVYCIMHENCCCTVYIMHLNCMHISELGLHVVFANCVGLLLIPIVKYALHDT